MAKRKSIHEIGRELHAELSDSPDATLKIPYAEFRERFGIDRRDTAKLNPLRRVLESDCKVFVYPVVNGQAKRGTTHTWSKFSDHTTHVLCQLRGATSPTATLPRPVDANADACVSDDNVMQVVAAPGKHPHDLYKHQEVAVRRMSEKMHAGFAGVLVLPTGGGKTRTAVHWLLSDVIDKGGKVLWLAHRHSLIDQAFNVFRQTAYRGDVLHGTARFICRKVFGQHARPFDLNAGDDVVIGSVYSFGRSTGLKFLRDKWLCDDRPICLVVDEAHHAPAPTYRKVIDEVRAKRPELRILGLTATPYRTAKSEQGLMKKMFPGDVIHKVDLQELVTQGILAEPHFEDVRTDVRFDLDDQSVNTLIRTGGDFSKLGDGISRTIGENSKRNRAIVDHYVANKNFYGRTIIFSLNIANAIALTKLLRNRDIAAGYVVSSIYDADRLVKRDAELNEKAIEDFRNGKLEVLVNVNILTEGFDDPKVQTVFLARPTMSSIMMMQMIGRALRGPKAGGTPTATVRSAVDDLALREKFQEPTAPTAIRGKKLLEDCSMAELYEKHRERWRELRDAVFGAAFDRKTKVYRCALTGWQSTDRSQFQIDHIKPRSRGGKTLLENLRLVRRRENAMKGDKWEWEWE